VISASREVGMGRRQTRLLTVRHMAAAGVGRELRRTSGESQPSFDYKCSTVQSGCVKGGSLWPS